MADSYYIQIDGKKYDRGLIEAANKAVEDNEDGHISKDDAEVLLVEVKDGNRYTAIEKSTVKYIRNNHAWTPEADTWFRQSIRKWAAQRGKKALVPNYNPSELSKPNETELTQEAPLPVPDEDTVTAQFGSLRSILQQTASTETWRQFMTWCEDNIGVLGAEEVHVYVVDMIKRWPKKQTRLLSSKLLASYIFGPTPPEWLLDCVTGAHVDQSFLAYSGIASTRGKALAHWSLAHKIDVLQLGEEVQKVDNIDDGIFAIGGTKNWTHLKHLVLYGGYMSDDILYALNVARFPNLETLELHGFSDFSTPGHEELCSAKYLPHHIKYMAIEISRTRWDEYFECWE